MKKTIPPSLNVNNSNNNIKLEGYEDVVEKTRVTTPKERESSKGG
jgi:hypothetical protein